MALTELQRTTLTKLRTTVSTQNHQLEREQREQQEREERVTREGGEIGEREKTKTKNLIFWFSIMGCFRVCFRFWFFKFWS